MYDPIQTTTYPLKAIIGAPVFDEVAGKTKYYTHIIPDGKEFSSAPIMPMIPTKEKAKIARDELARRLAKSGIESTPTLEILHFPDFGFELRVVIDTNGNQKDLETIAAVLSSFGVPV